MPAANRIVLEGPIGGTQERWSTGLWFAPPSGAVVGGSSNLALWAAAIGDGLAAAITGTLLNGLSTTGAVDRIRAYSYSSIIGPASEVGESVENIAGGSGGKNPLPTAMVVSLRTGLAGRRNRGRMYWPAVGLVVNNQGRWGPTDTAGGASGAKALLNLIADTAPGVADMSPVVASRAGNYVTPVTSVSVGDVPDAQRRRREGLVEVYATASL